MPEIPVRIVMYFGYPWYEALAFHLISMHCDPMAIWRGSEDNLDQHAHEHRGPGTIRNHKIQNMSWDEEKIEAILEEIEMENGIVAHEEFTHRTPQVMPNSVDINSCCWTNRGFG
jgi:hypothetical protein